MYGEIYITDNGSNSRYVEPLNYDAITIKTSKVTESGAWAFQTEMNDVQISGVDFRWLYDLMLLDKCKVWNIQFIKDGSIKYNGEFNYYMCRVDFDNCIISIDSKKVGKLQKVLSCLNKQYLIGGTSNQFIINPLEYKDILNYRNGLYYKGVKVLDVINEILGSGFLFGNNTGLTVESQFLTSTFTPMPFNHNYLIDDQFIKTFETLNVTVNRYNKLYLAVTPSGNSNTIDASLSDILSELANSLKLRWYVNDDTNKLVIEHYKYFENGLSYVGLPQIGIDLTTLNDGNYLNETNRYKSIIKERPSAYNIRYDINTDNALPLTEQYSSIRTFSLYSKCALTRNQTEVKIGWNTSIVDAELAGTETTTILACEEVYSINNNLIISILDYPVTIPVYNYTGHIINYPFDANLISQFHLYEQYEEEMNFYNLLNNRIILSQNKNLMQDAIKFNYCDNIDPYKLVKTTLLNGNGYIDSFDVDLYGTVQIELRYEDN